MLYHIPDLEQNRRQKICSVAKGLSNNPDNWTNRYIFHLFKHCQKKGISGADLIEHAPF